jgi:hypothetical protein
VNFCIINILYSRGGPQDSFKPFGTTTFVSFIGGTGTDSIESVVFDSNNDLWILGTTTSFDGVALQNPTNPSNGSAGTGGFVMKFNRLWQREVRNSFLSLSFIRLRKNQVNDNLDFSRAAFFIHTIYVLSLFVVLMLQNWRLQLFFQACAGNKIAVPPDGTIWLSCSPNIIHLDATATTILGNFPGYSNNSRQIEWVASDADPLIYDLLVLDPGPFFNSNDSLSRLPGASGSTTRLWLTPIGRSGTAAMAFDRNTNMIYVGGVRIQYNDL